MPKAPPIRFDIYANDRSRGAFRSVQRNAQSALRTVLAFTGLTLGAREIRQYADAWTEASNKIAAAEEIAGRHARSLSGVNEIAERTRTSLADTADLYAKLLRSTSDVAESEMEVARATEIVNKAFKAGGASLQEQTAGIRQLAQALASGYLQGDELRSIRENAPLVAQALADEFNTTIGGLKQLGAEGKLTTDRLFKAIIEGGDEIEAAFARTKPTIEDLFTILGNGFTEYVGSSEAAANVTEALARAVLKVAKAMREADPEADGLAGWFGDLAEDANKLVRGLQGTNIELQGLITAWGKIQDFDFSGALAAIGKSQKMAAAYMRGELYGPPLPPGYGETPPGEGEGGSGNQGAASAEADKIQDVIEALEFQAQQLTRTAEQQEVYNNLNRAGVDINTEAGRRIATLTSELYQAELQQERLNNSLQFGGELALDVFDRITDSTDNWRDALLDVVSVLKRAVLEAALLGQGPLANLFGTAASGGAPGGLFGLLFSAKGNAFNGGKVMPFARGGVVNRPTLFPMASGAGLMGEAGPEAILPLRRGAGGRLGVEASGGGGGDTFHMPITIQGNADMDAVAKLRKEIPAIVVKTVRETRSRRIG